MTVRTRGSAVDSLDLLMRCPSQDMGSAWWWASLTHHLGELGEELASTDVAGLAAQITTDAPHFAAAAHRLPAIDEQAQCDVARLRREVNAQTGRRRWHATCATPSTRCYAGCVPCTGSAAT